ncbi:hypothetical protein ZWY2020_037742 [Hordeum vulgare]|nr:hypothetical protein ZWY2020_037742 [Hordeum vulgare]
METLVPMPTLSCRAGRIRGPPRWISKSSLPSLFRPPFKPSSVSISGTRPLETAAMESPVLAPRIENVALEQPDIKAKAAEDITADDMDAPPEPPTVEGEVNAPSPDGPPVPAIPLTNDIAENIVMAHDTRDLHWVFPEEERVIATQSG